MSVRVELSRIFIREMTEMQVIELTEKGGTRSFPIVIGLTEACAIERRLKGCEVARPQSHDLMANIIAELGASINRIEIPELKNGTFFAKVILKQGDRVIELDARPSDAIALGVSSNAPIYVAEAVLAEASLGASSSTPPPFDGEDVEDDDDDDSDEESTDL